LARAVIYPARRIADLLRQNAAGLHLGHMGVATSVKAPYENRSSGRHLVMSTASCARGDNSAREADIIGHG